MDLPVSAVRRPRQHQRDRLRAPAKQRDVRELVKKPGEVKQPEVEAEHREQHEVVARAIAQHNRGADRKRDRRGQERG